MKNNFKECLARVLKDEGGYGNDPADSGGPTKYGITIHDVQAYVKRGATAEDVKRLTVAQASSIYKSKYWDALGCDNLTSGVDYTCFDYGVNSGLRRPRNALAMFKDSKGPKLIDEINDERVKFLESISHGKNAKFLHGWLSRVGRVRSYSHALYHKTDTVTGPVVGTGTVAATITLSQYFHQYEAVILISGIILAVAIGVGVHLFKNKGN